LADNADRMLVAKPPTSKRWPRGQKFSLSPVGAAAEEAYRAAVLAARTSGRASLDAALTAWAVPHGLTAADGIVLAELSGKRLGIAELCDALDAAGIVPEDVRAAIGRLVSAGIVDPLPLRSQLERDL
jgi:hypothetical protein